MREVLFSLNVVDIADSDEVLKDVASKANIIKTPENTAIGGGTIITPGEVINKGE